MPDFTLILALGAVILTATALLSGLVERSPLSFPLMFLALGFVLGSGGFGVIEMGLGDPILEGVAALTLSLVLFLDAVKFRAGEVGSRWIVPVLVLGPGTALIIALGAVPLALLIGFGWVLAFIGGAVLASTDPVVLRDIIRDPRVPRSVRQVLKIEAGMNDIVVLPVILVLIAVARSQAGGVGEWATLMTRLLLVGPVIGFAVGGVGSWLMSNIDRRMGIRQEHQALYGIGLVLAAYAAATFAGGDGFLAAFFAGIAVVVLNQRLCDCFLDYGETTAEMAMLLAFVLFGAVLSGIIRTVSPVPTLILAALIVFVIRPSVLGVVLLRARAHMSWEAQAFVCWFGPRGLNSLLLALLVVGAGVAGAELLLATVGVVVLVSVAIHGASATPLSALYGRMASSHTLEEEREGTAAGLFSPHLGDVPRIRVDELDGLLAAPSPPLVLDVRSRSTYMRDNGQIPGSVRVQPDEVSDLELPVDSDQMVVVYCT